MVLRNRMEEQSSMSTKASISALFINRLMAFAERIDAADREQAKRCLLDHMGVTLAGAFELNERYALILVSMGNSGTVPVIGTRRKADLLVAALLNGMSAHQLELDDGHRFGMVHPGAPVISALLPLVQAERLSGDDLLRGIVVGYEAAIRLAIAVQPSMKHKGYHATGTCGAIGAALGAGFALRLDREQLLATLAAAATQASGILEVIRDGSQLKPFNAGQAAMHGLVAVTMGRAGFAGPADVLGGKQGLLSVLSDAPKAEVLLAIGQERPAIHGIYVKPYAACRHCHPPVEAALTLRLDHAILPADVSAVRVHTYGLAVHLHDHRQVQGSADAKMSTPYSVAAALVAGEAGMAQFSEQYLQDPEVQRIMGVVQVKEEPTMSAKVPHERGARVEITLRDGRSLSTEVKLPKGDPENPLTPAEFVDKFKDLASYAGHTDERIEAIFAATMNVEADVDELFKHTVQ
jgi:2-methylcitrate dehydratase PrpD